MEHGNQKKVTLPEVHEKLKNAWRIKKDELQTVIGFKTKSTYYDIISGQRKLSPADKEAFAKIYGYQVEQIEWNDSEILIA